MDELVRFLRARYDEDEQIARAAPDGPWSMDGSGSIVDGTGGRVVPSVGGARNGRATRWPEDPAAEHIAQHDPARVLRDTEARQQELDLHQPEPGQHPDFCGYDRHELPCRPLRLLALPYSDHPDYREAWRP